MDEVRDVAVRELEAERAVVVAHDVVERREAAVVVEAALLVGPEPCERGSIGN